jgi:hypothetical protein
MINFYLLACATTTKSDEDPSDVKNSRYFTLNQQKFFFL